MRITIDIMAGKVEALNHLSMNGEISLFVDKVLREAEKVSEASITESRAIQEVNPYFSRDF